MDDTKGLVIMSQNNNYRFDLSERLIHFFRPLDLDKAGGFIAPEAWGPGDLAEDTIVSPFFMLRNAIRIDRLWATWSYRNDVRTVYGRNPAVCFTEMPLAAFIEAGEVRASRDEAMSPYGLIFSKAALFQAGGRPVIYGLSTSPLIPSGNGGGERIIPETSLPLAEQYRYVTYAPSSQKRIDWTHEREWRWPYRGDLPNGDDYPLESGRDMPGLDFEAAQINGIGAVVKTRLQVEKVVHDALSVMDRENAGFSRYEFVVAREDIKDLSRLRDPQEVEQVISSAAIKFAPFFNQRSADRAQHLGDFSKAVHDTLQAHSGYHPHREHGGCWLWISDNRHPMTRALVASGRVTVNKSLRYLVHIPEFDSKPDLSERETLTKSLAELLKQRFNLEATYHSVRDSIDPDGVPHYSNPPFQNDFHFNYGNDPSDF
jgi:hypothetical protein